MPDLIHIEQLELSSFIGVADEERAVAQRLTGNLTLEQAHDFQALGDALKHTVDYSAVCEAVKALSLARPRNLIETLAEEIAAHLLERFALRAVEVELRKFILPDTAHVAVKIVRRAF